METTSPVIKVNLLIGDSLQAHRVSISCPGGESLRIDFFKPCEEGSFSGGIISPRTWVFTPSTADPSGTLELKGHSSQAANIVIFNWKSRVATLVLGSVERLVIGLNGLVEPYGGLQPVPINGSDFSWLALGNPNIHNCPMEGSRRRRSRSKVS